MENVNSSIEKESDYFDFMIEDKLPVDAKQIRKEIRKDSILSRVYMYVRDGWPDQVDDSLRP